MSFFILVLVANVYVKYLSDKIQPIPNTRYLPITKLVCEISGVIACGLLLSILLPPIWWWIILCQYAFKSIREVHGSYHQICELLHDIYQQISESLHDMYQQISNSLHGMISNPIQQAGPQAFNDNSMRQEGEGGCPRVQNV